MRIVVMLDGAPKGPFDLDGLKLAIQGEKIGLCGPAWQDGQDQWIKLPHIPELESAPATSAGGARPSGFAAAEADQHSFRRARKDSSRLRPSRCSYLYSRWYNNSRGDMSSPHLQTKKGPNEKCSVNCGFRVCHQ